MLMSLCHLACSDPLLPVKTVTSLFACVEVCGREESFWWSSFYCVASSQASCDPHH